MAKHLCKLSQSVKKNFETIADLVDRPTSSVHRRYQQALAELGKMINKQTDSPSKTDEPRPSIL